MHRVFFITLFTSVSCTTYTCSSTAGCGCSVNSAVVNKIVGGETASPRTWSWAASLRYSNTGSHFCGGSIISRSHILTAAHCTIELNADDIRVFVGSIYLSSATQVRNVLRIYNHPYYSSSTYRNDIAILELSSPLDLDQTNVNLVCLPNISSRVLASGEYPSPNTNLVAIGWGVLAESSTTVSQILRQVTIQAVAADTSYCRNVDLADVSTQFCAGTMPGGGKDTCQGDSGSPVLMFTSDNVWQQVGITSVGVGCARANSPGIYTRVAAYQSWIINTPKSSVSAILTISYTIVIPVILCILL